MEHPDFDPEFDGSCPRCDGIGWLDQGPGVAPTRCTCVITVDICPLHLTLRDVADTLDQDSVQPVIVRQAADVIERIARSVSGNPATVETWEHVGALLRGVGYDIAPPGVLTSESPRAHATGRTELAAALAALPEAGTNAALVLDQFRTVWPHGLSDDALEDRLAGPGRLWPGTPTKRRHDLKRGGWVVDSGERALTKANRPAIVWTLSPLAREYLNVGQRLPRSPAASDHPQLPLEQPQPQEQNP